MRGEGEVEGCLRSFSDGLGWDWMVLLLGPNESLK